MMHWEWKTFPETLGNLFKDDLVNSWSKELGLTSCEVQEIGGELRAKEQGTAKTKLCYVKSD